MTESLSQKVAVSFARRYYATLVEQPAALASFYAPNARVRHLNHPSPKVDSEAELQKLLGTVSFGSVGKVSRVDLTAIGVAGTASGNIAISLEGVLHADGAASHAAGQAFQQEVELREIAGRTYAIVADVLHFEPRGTAAPVTAPAAAWALDTPPMFAQKDAPAEVAAMQQPPVSTASTAPLAPAAAAEKAATEATPAAAAPEAESAATPAASVEAAAPAAKAPQSFAEALRIKKTAAPADGKKPSAPVRVTDKVVAAPAAEKPKEERKRTKPATAEAATGATTAAAGGKAAAAPKKRPAEGPAAATAEGKKRPARAAAPGTSSPVIFYDVIIKNLPQSSAEADVRAMLAADVPVSLVKVQSKAARSDPTDLRTFAFVQLDAAALKAAGADKKEMLARVVAEGNASGTAQQITFEEVREKRKYAGAGAERPRHAGARRPTDKPTTTKAAPPAEAVKA